jgi:hypothetical protein
LENQSSRGNVTPEVLLHELLLVLHDELHYAQLVSEGKVDREIKCRGGLWRIVVVDGELHHRDLVPRIQDGYDDETVGWDSIRDDVIADQLRSDLQITTVFCQHDN